MKIETAKQVVEEMGMVMKFDHLGPRHRRIRYFVYTDADRCIGDAPINLDGEIDLAIFNRITERR